MTDHPITPPPELFAQWIADAMKVVGRKIPEEDGGTTGLIAAELALQAARWGADQELEACCTWLSDHGWIAADPELRTARRPKPPSLKEQALGAVGRFTVNDHTSASEMMRDFDIIRRALEVIALPQRFVAISWCNHHEAAAALRAAADQLKLEEPFGNTDADAGVFAAHQAIHAGLLALAAKLEGNNG